MSTSGAERRAHTRTRIDIPASMAGSGVEERAVSISDVSQGGLYLSVRLTPNEVKSPLGSVIGDNGDVVVRCTRLDGRELSIEGEAARVTIHGLGMSFVGDQPQVVRALMAQAGAPAAEATDTTDSVDAADRPELLNLLKDVVVAWLPGRIKAFTDQSEARLVSRASLSHSNAEQTPFFDAITELQRRRAELEPEMAEILQVRVDNLGETIHNDEMVDRSSSGAGGLSLVDKDDFEIFLSVAGMSTKAENRNDQRLFELGRRLSSVCGVVIDNTNNPVAPSSICDPFHERMRDAAMTTDALGIVYSCFDDLVMGDIGRLYEQLNAALEKAGVEVGADPEPAKAESAKDEPTRATRLDDDVSPEPERIEVAEDSVEESGDSFSDSDMLEIPMQSRTPEPLADHGMVSSAFGGSPFQGGTPFGDHRSGRSYDAPSEGTDMWGSAEATPEPVWTRPAGLASQRRRGGGPAATVSPYASFGSAGGAPGVAGVPGSPGLPGGVQGGVPGFDGGPGFGGGGGIPSGQLPYPQNFNIPALPGTAFGAAHTMLGLTRTLGTGGAGGVIGGGGALSGGGRSVMGSAFAGGGMMPGTPSVSAVGIEQLVGILHQLQSVIGSNEGGGNFRGRLREALTTSDDGPRSLYGAMGDAVELVMGLFEAFRDDAEVGPDLLSRLDMLEPPTHKVALLDANFFEISEHPARQVLNQLARLEPDLGDGDWPSGDFWEAIDELLAPLLKSFERDVSLYSDVLAELDRLVSRQVQTYKENVGAVVAACDAQQAFVQARRGMDESRRASGLDPSERGVSKEWGVWLNRAARLEAGENLEIFFSDSDPRRVTLAWIGGGHNSFVFVDKRGEKLLTLSRQELAMQLRRGSASIARATELPLVDRALNRVLQDLHGLLERRATRDLRTGLLNRKSFLPRLRDALERPVSEGDGVATLAFAIIDYATVVESAGSDAGDILLRRVARRMSGVLGDAVTIACIDDSTLAAFIGNTTLEHGERVADRVCESIAELRIRWGEGDPFSPRLRASVILAAPGESPAAVLEMLEDNVHERGGTGRVSSEALAPSIVAGEVGESDYATLIQKTLGSERLQLRCHRIAPLAPGRRDRSHFEILLGVRDDQGEAIPAADFVRAAEGHGQMPAVDRWVMRQSLRWMAEKRRWLRKVAGFAINLSGASLGDPHLVEYVLEQLSQTGVPPGKIIFEVTETEAIGNISHAQNFLRTLSEVGCRFALDDFGSGQSSYGYLKQLPVDYVKIDGMFVRDLETDEADLAVVRSVNEIAHFMGKKTIAEFVQSATTVAKLREIGVDLGQGFFIEKPMYLEDATEEVLGTAPEILTQADTYPQADDGTHDIAEATLGL
jgi:EAL domain-containing protein (putative c-di-GMP-specific phosphodiesterase class I)/GGDEF domain-containing protein